MSVFGGKQNLWIIITYFVFNLAHTQLLFGLFILCFGSSFVGNYEDFIHVAISVFYSISLIC